MKALTLLLTLFISVVSSKFEPYACIGDKATKLRIWNTRRETIIYQETIDNELVEHYNVTAKTCERSCQNFAFMFFKPEQEMFPSSSCPMSICSYCSFTGPNQRRPVSHVRLQQCCSHQADVHNNDHKYDDKIYFHD